MCHPMQGLGFYMQLLPLQSLNWAVGILEAPWCPAPAYRQVSESVWGGAARPAGPEKAPRCPHLLSVRSLDLRSLPRWGPLLPKEADAAVGVRLVGVELLQDVAAHKVPLLASPLANGPQQPSLNGVDVILDVVACRARAALRLVEDATGIPSILAAVPVSLCLAVLLATVSPVSMRFVSLLAV